MKRRNFVKASALAGLSLALGSCSKEKLELDNERIYTPVLIIGSGFGGSVTALRLSQAGIDNILLERGRSWKSHEFNSFTGIDEKSTWLKNEALVPIVNLKIPIKKYVGVIEYHRYFNMDIFNAAGLGGGSLVFGATYVKPTKEIFERVFPSEVSFDEMDALYFNKVQQEVNFSYIPEDIYQSRYYQYARSFKEHVLRTGKEPFRLPASYDWDIIRKELEGEIPLEFLKGDGNYGTRNDSKFSLDKTYISKAVNLGKTSVLTQHNVVNISIRSDKKYEIQVEQINERGDVMKKKVIVTDKLFLCAGTPNTIKLLLKAKETSNLNELNNSIGSGFGTNGKTFFRRIVKENTGRFTGWTPAEGVAHFDNPFVPIMIENIPQPTNLIISGPDLKSHFHVGLAATTYRGKFTYNLDKDRLNLDWSKNGLDESIAAASHWAEQINVVNPGTYVDNGLIADKFANNLTYHPLGGCVIGQSTDYYGRVLEYPNLYVNDSTLIPGVAACANPAFTIAALAERNIAKIIAEDFV